MSKIKPYELQEFFNQRNERVKELLETFSKETNNKSALILSGYRTRAVREANDEMLIQLLEKLDLLENK